MSEVDVIKGGPVISVTLKPLPLEDPTLLAMVDQGKLMVQKAAALEVHEGPEAKLASADLSLIAGVKKRMDDKKKEYLGPIRLFLADINRIFDEIMSPVLEADNILRIKVSSYLAEEKRKEEEAADITRKQIELAERARALEDSGGEKVELDAPEVEVVLAPERVRSDLGLVSKRANWKFRVVDISKVPREYLVVDTAQLTAIARSHHDQKPIDGIEFYNDETIQVRR